jgi:hypothetical protein
MKACSKCKVEKELLDFNKDKTKKDGLTSSCKECKRKVDNKYSKNNKEKRKDYTDSKKEEKKAYDKKYREDNKERRKELSKRYLLKNRKPKKIKETNYVYKFKVNVRNLIKNSFKRNGNNYKKRTSSEDILGCTIQEFKIYIENKFTDGMTFENHGEWHLDHIVPLALAKTEDEVLKLNHYTNFQPLWAVDNLKKGSKIFVVFKS